MQRGSQRSFYPQLVPVMLLLTHSFPLPSSRLLSFVLPPLPLPLQL